MVGLALDCDVRRFQSNMSVDGFDGIILSRQGLFRCNILVVVWSGP